MFHLLQIGCVLYHWRKIAWEHDLVEDIDFVEIAVVALMSISVVEMNIEEKEEVATELFW